MIDPPKPSPFEWAVLPLFLLATPMAAALGCAIITGALAVPVLSWIVMGSCLLAGLFVVGWIGYGLWWKWRQERHEKRRREG